MGEGLGEVAQVAPAVGVQLLGVELEGAGQGQQLLAQLAGPDVLADLGQGGHEPERADGEAALLSRQPVVGLLDLVAQDEPVHRQVVGDGEHGGPYPGIVGGQEAHQGDEQHRGVQGRGVVVLPEHAVLDAPGAHLGVDLVGARLPAVGPLEVLPDAGQAGPPVGRHPAHHLGRGEVLGVAPYLPDAPVRLPPVRQGGLDLAAEDGPEALVEPVP